MNRRRVSTQVLFSFIMMMFLMVIGCSGGGSDEAAPAPAAKTISGIAAAGAPIIGTVTIKDSSSTPIERVTTIAADGSYSIDVSGMKAPFALRADGYVGGRTYHLYSAAVNADINGTINITPFTDLIIANMAQQIAEEYYTSGAFSSMTNGELTAAEAALQAKLQPILTALGVSASIDLLRTSFNADHTGLDRVIDVVKVTVDPATVEATLTNILNEETITVNIAAGGTTTGPAFTDTGVAGGVTAFQAITNVFSTFTSLFATSLPSPSNTTLVNLVDATFLHDGQNRDSFLSQITSNSSMIGISFTNVVLLSIDEVAGTAVVSFVINQNGIPGTETMNMIKTGGTWRMAGNRRIAYVNIRAVAQYLPNDGIVGTHIWSGLRVNIDASYPAGAAVQSAVITGSGLPGGGFILNKIIGNSNFMGKEEQLPISHSNLYYLTNDTTIGAIPDNAEYNIVLKSAADGGGSVLATYTDTILKRPLKNSELSVASFPAISAPTLTALQAYSGGNLTITWTLPTGLKSELVDLILTDAGGTHSALVESSLKAVDTSKSLTITTPAFTVAGRRLMLKTIDIYDRRFETELWQND